MISRLKTAEIESVLAPCGIPAPKYKGEKLRIETKFNLFMECLEGKHDEFLGLIINRPKKDE